MAPDLDDPIFPKVVPVDDLANETEVFSREEVHVILSMIFAGIGGKYLPEDGLEVLLLKLEQMRKDGSVVELILKRLVIPSFGKDGKLMLKAATVSDVAFSDKCLKEFSQGTN